MAFDGKPVVYIGWDSREAVASDVLAHSIRRKTRTPLSIKYLKHRDLRRSKHFNRPWMIDGDNGEFIDSRDGKPFSTEFSHTRFLVPALNNYQGWALFIDSDMIFLSDIKKLFSYADDKYAVMCVKHKHQPPANSIKMDHRLQLQYYRKNWSSFVLWNCGHPKNKFMTLEMVNHQPGGWMHAFEWLKDEEIGALPFSYNYISGVSPPMEVKEAKGKERDLPDVIHYTEGGPWFSNCKHVAFSDLWDLEYNNWRHDGEVSGDE